MGQIQPLGFVCVWGGGCLKRFHPRCKVAGGEVCKACNFMQVLSLIDIMNQSNFILRWFCCQTSSRNRPLSKMTI